MEVPEQLASVVKRQRFANFLALDEDLNFATFQDGVIDLLAFFGAYIADVFRDHLGRIENVVAQHRMDEWHDKGVFGGFFRLYGCALLANLDGQTVQFFSKFHFGIPSFRKIDPNAYR
ncbi:hypothetical protein D3C85_1390650 [compost metagenome]